LIGGLLEPGDGRYFILRKSAPVVAEPSQAFLSLNTILLQAAAWYRKAAKQRDGLAPAWVDLIACNPRLNRSGKHVGNPSLDWEEHGTVE
jgi:hypothetical protein